MANGDDEDFWNTSSMKGFSFNENEEVESGLFGVSFNQTARLSQQLRENLVLDQKPKLKSSTSTSSLNSLASGSSGISSAPTSILLEPIKYNLNTNIGYQIASPSAREAVLNLMLGRPCSLHAFRSLQQKQELLDQAVTLADGDAITAVTFYLKKTLNSSLFNRLMAAKPIACQQYLSVLLAKEDYTVALDFLTMLGRGVDAAMLSYKHSISRLLAAKQKREPVPAEQTVRSLQTCYKNHFHAAIELEDTAVLLQEHIELLQRQIALSSEVQKRPVPNSPLPSSHLIGQVPMAAELVGSALLPTLQYCCRNHWSTTDALLGSPSAMRQRFEIEDKAWIWNAVATRAVEKDFDAVEKLLITKSLLGSAKYSGHVPLTRLVEILFQLCGSSPILDRLLVFVDPSDARLSLAKKFKRYRVVVDTFTALKDRQALQQYMEFLEPGTQDRFYAEQALKTSTVRWKN